MNLLKDDRKEELQKNHLEIFIRKNKKINKNSVFLQNLSLDNISPVEYLTENSQYFQSKRNTYNYAIIRPKHLHKIKPNQT